LENQMNAFFSIRRWKRLQTSLGQAHVLPTRAQWDDLSEALAEMPFLDRAAAALREHQMGALLEQTAVVKSLCDVRSVSTLDARLRCLHVIVEYPKIRRGALIVEHPGICCGSPLLQTLSDFLTTILAPDAPLAWDCVELAVVCARWITRRLHSSNGITRERLCDAVFALFDKDGWKRPQLTFLLMKFALEPSVQDASSRLCVLFHKWILTHVCGDVRQCRGEYYSDFIATVVSCRRRSVFAPAAAFAPPAAVAPATAFAAFAPAAALDWEHELACALGIVQQRECMSTQFFEVLWRCMAASTVDDPQLFLWQTLEDLRAWSVNRHMWCCAVARGQVRRRA
jgi:hypothetical protein